MHMFSSLRRWVRPVVSVAVTLAAVYFVWHNWAQVRYSLEVIRHMPLRHFWFLLGLMALTFLLAAFSYSFLVFRRLAIRELLLIELAAACVNRIVPSGLGGLGLHGIYLRHRRHTVAQATAVVSINNLVGMLVHLAMFGGVLLAGATTPIHLGWSKQQGWILVGVIAVIASMVLSPRLRQIAARFLRNLLKSLQRYGREPHRLVYAGLAMVGLTLANVCILYLAAHSVGVLLGAPTLFMVYSAGVLVGAAVPTPGGLAGVEAGLVGGFMLYGVGGTTAIAIALAFRFITYWLPILPGALALYTARYCRLV